MAATTKLKHSVRRYEHEDDYWRMRDLLRRAYASNHQRLLAWHVARLDYARWHVCLNVAGVQLEDVVYLWEAGDRIVGIMMPDGGPGEAHPMIHPAQRDAGLEAEMVRIAQERLARTLSSGLRELTVWVPRQDETWSRLLSQAGYRRSHRSEYQWRRDLDRAIEESPVPAGYEISPLGEGLELLERCYASGLAFHEGDLRIAVENRDDPGWYRNIQNAPLYRRDLDLVAWSPQKAVAAYCTIWFDDVTRSAYFEPVGTVPAHRRRGLGRALLGEGLRRAQRMGATRAFVCGYSDEANALYRSAMGPEYDLVDRWKKEWLAA
jgi:ribosomal protein S18 acetylase RimI-like enzyme